LMTSASSAKQSGLNLASAILPRCSQWLREASFTGAAGGIAGCPVPGGQRPLGPIALHPSASRSSKGVPPLPAWPEPACAPAAGFDLWGSKSALRGDRVLNNSRSTTQRLFGPARPGIRQGHIAGLRL
jgi:hypothetical protein